MQAFSHRLRTGCAVFLIVLIGLYVPFQHNSVRADSSITGHWKQMPPYGGTVYSLAIDPIDPARLYAGTSGGLFRSAYHGLNWKTANEGLPLAEFKCLAIDPVTPSTLYAGTLGSGLFRSTDGGLTWARGSTGLADDISVNSLGIDPLHPSTLYAGTDDGVFRSVDGGAHWTSPSSALIGTKVSCLAVDKVSPSTLYAGTSSGVFASSDSGTTWAKASTGLTSLTVQSVAIDPVTASTLYAGTADGVFRSTDSGTTWIAASSGLANKDVNCLVIDPASPSTLYAGTASGVCRSTDGGSSWTRPTNELSDADVLTVAIDSTAPSALYAGTLCRGLYKSGDSALTWTWSHKGLYVSYVTALATNPSLPDTFLVGALSGLYTSTDGGGSWEVLDAPIVWDIVFDPATPSTVYVATWLYCVGRTTSSLHSWTFSISPDLMLSSCLAIDPVTPSTLYVGTLGKGVFRSTDRGDTWAKWSTGLTSNRVRDLAIDPVTGSTLYASTDDGLFRSTNRGQSWKIVCAEAGSGAIAIDPRTPSTVYAAGSLGIYRSTDGGDTWKLCSGPGMILKPTAVAVDPMTTSTVYAGAAGAVFCSTDAGDTWIAMSMTGLPPSKVNSISIVSGTPTTLYACTDRGLFRWSTSSPPSAPTGLTATSSATTVRLSWSASTTGTSPLAGYAVYRSTTAGSLGDAPIATVGAAVTSWTDTACRQGITYYYAVAAFDEQGTPLYSAKSSEVSAKLLTPPTIVLTLTLQLGNTRMLVSGSDGTSDTVTLDAAPVLGAGNRTLVPVRAVAEAMGGTVGWDPVTRTASVTVGSNTLELTLGKNTALYNGKATPIDTDPKVLPLIINGRTMLPLRFVVESLGAEVSYDQATKTITITYTKS